MLLGCLNFLIFSVDLYNHSIRFDQVWNCHRFRSLHVPIKTSQKCVNQLPKHYLSNCIRFAMLRTRLEHPWSLHMMWIFLDLTAFSTAVVVVVHCTRWPNKRAHTLTKTNKRTNDRWVSFLRRFFLSVSVYLVRSTYCYWWLLLVEHTFLHSIS